MDKKFIMTTSEETAKMLEECGFPLIQKNSAGWMFLNNSTKAIHFSEKDSKSICFTDIYHC